MARELPRARRGEARSGRAARERESDAQNEMCVCGGVCLCEEEDRFVCDVHTREWIRLDFLPSVEMG
jgi:hypothetical protein